MNITSYLLTPEQARWAKEKGFTNDCFASFHIDKPNEVKTDADIHHSNLFFRGPRLDAYVANPTFDQFFDWVEEKWGICVRIEPNEHYYSWVIYQKMNINNWHNMDMESPDKRSARIACVNEIIKYIDNLK